MGADATDDYVENPHFGDANLNESHLGAHRLFEINHHIVAISGFSVYQRLQRPRDLQPFRNSGEQIRLVRLALGRLTETLTPLTATTWLIDFITEADRAVSIRFDSLRLCVIRVPKTLGSPCNHQRPL